MFRLLGALLELAATVIRPRPATIGQTRREARIDLNADGTFTFTDRAGRTWRSVPRFEDDDVVLTPLVREYLEGL